MSGRRKAIGFHSSRYPRSKIEDGVFYGSNQVVFGVLLGCANLFWGGEVTKSVTSLSCV